MKNKLEYIGKIYEGYHEPGGLRIGGTNLGKIGDEVDYYLSKTNKQIHVSYFISDVELTKEEFLENHLLTVFGAYKIGAYDVYGSEWTGYMWTDQDFKVAGHDLVGELSSHKGKFCYLKIYNAVEKRNIAIDDVLKK